MHKDKRALAATLRKYHRHILGPLFVEAADAIEELLDTVEAQKAEIITMTAEPSEDEKNAMMENLQKSHCLIMPDTAAVIQEIQCGDEPCEACRIGGNADGTG